MRPQYFYMPEECHAKWMDEDVAVALRDEPLSPSGREPSIPLNPHDRPAIHPPHFRISSKGKKKPGRITASGGWLGGGISDTDKGYGDTSDTVKPRRATATWGLARRRHRRRRPDYVPRNVLADALPKAWAERADGGCDVWGFA
ncbi:uncharacterized protein PITG_02612 [Phytophthora infestans T30-4]|uniref:Uncharacterized protein n=1 Tax=Phytophthora infestans (strain T30-4) TaxID=403677 RepID=D0MWS3_PHYIT|nr:uncharacterized protein PITG_02612 [Phytophthora infestans T30-4]EEY64086.1 hypothetical protein PITG_02612 [Phytophthora infestans T30-4]|eukprot:XP_002907522.1 hypothetical protein PITG_02612 [Phytophthora infestans T30-4]